MIPKPKEEMRPRERPKPCSSAPGGPHGAIIKLLDVIHRAAWKQHVGTDPAAFGLQGQLNGLRVSLGEKIQLRKS